MKSSPRYPVPARVGPVRLVFLFALIVSGLGLAPVVAQAYTYTQTIPLTQQTLDGDLQTVSPGEVIGIAAGSRTRLIIKNLHGAPGNPIIIANQGGLARIGSEAVSEAVKLQNCSYVKVTGDGDATMKYGIEIFRGGGQCMEITDLSTDVEVCFLEIYGAGFAGIMFKTDPQCGGYATRGTFTQYNTVLHDNYIHDVGGEAFYVGNSFWASGVPAGVSGCSTVLYPADLVGVRIYNNIVERTGYEGIQVGCAISDSEIYNNRVIDSGTRNVVNQRNGIQLGEGTTGKCYNNFVMNTPANGLVLLGRGNIQVYNNVIVNSGTNGMFCDDRANPLSGSYVRIYNNTIINPAQNGFLTANNVSTNEFINNLTVIPNSGFSDGIISSGSGAVLTKNNNITATSATTLGFVNTATLDYRVLSSSSAVDAGANLSANGVTTDREGLARPFGAAFDAGASEFGAVSVYVTQTSPNAIGASNGSIQLSVIGGTAPYAYTWSDGGTGASRTGLPKGKYIATVQDAASNTVVRTIWLLDPPLLTVTSRSLPSLVGSNDGSITLTVTGGVPPYSVTWSNGGTGLAKSGLAPGFYTYTLTDFIGQVFTRKLFIRDGGTPIFRVNNGGAVETATHLNWAGDKSSTPAPQLVNPSASTTAGSNSWTGSKNQTEGPNNLFACYRAVKTTGTDMQWAFPVATAGYYEVQLYFNERINTISTGDRVFDVFVENTTVPVLDNFDIVATYGFDQPVQKTFLVQVTDGTLNINFQRVVGDPVVSGIAVHSMGTTMPAGIVLYRVNNGGIEETGTDSVNWLQDKTSTPSSYLASTGQNTTGSNSWNSGGTNFTDAPDDVFGSWRYDVATGMEMKWAFPVDPGAYRVNLYFIERDSAITGANQRFFDVSVEGGLFLADYDIYEFHGFLHPARESLIQEVTDGAVTIDFAHRTGGNNPIISGISIHRIR